MLVREADIRHGSARAFGTDLPAVRCGSPGCVAVASFGAPGAPWPTRCAAHAEPGHSPCGLDRSRAPDDALSYSLIESSGTTSQAVVDPAALALAAEVLAPHLRVVADLTWFPEYEFRTISVSKLLAAVGMQKQPGAAGRMRGSGEEDGGSGERPAREAAPPPASEASVLRGTLRALALGAPAPPLPPDAEHHVCLICDHTCPTAVRVCAALRAALTDAFVGARVFFVEDPAEVAGAAAAAAASLCVVPFLTRALLRPGSAGAAAVAAGLARSRRFIVPYEMCRERGGTPSVQDLITETAPEARGLWQFTAFPWMGDDPQFIEVCALRLVLDGVMEVA